MVFFKISVTDAEMPRVRPSILPRRHIEGEGKNSFCDSKGYAAQQLGAMASSPMHKDKAGDAAIPQKSLEFATSGKYGKWYVGLRANT